MQVIGEAARRVGPDFTKAHPEVPWRAIVGMRHRVVDEYLHVDRDIVWDVVTRELAPLAKLLREISAGQGE